MTGKTKTFDERNDFERTNDLDSFHLRQALEGEYPKLLKLQNDLINRLNQLHNGFSDLEVKMIEETKNNDEETDQKQKLDFFSHFCIEKNFDRFANF